MLQWLKDLRLHKYTFMFEQMTFDQFTELNAEKLDELDITLGARKRLLVNLEKLRGRAKRLEELKKVSCYAILENVNAWLSQSLRYKYIVF